MPEIFHLFNIKTADAAKVYKAITDRNGLASWWTTETNGASEVGNIIEFRFSENDKLDMNVITLNKNKTVEWECVGGNDEWIGTKIKFELEQKENSVNVKFYHTDWKQVTEHFGVCNYHWGLYMKSLKSYIENGKGNPHKPILN